MFCQPLSEARRQLLPGVGYYTLQVKVGAGAHDVITLHRVVAESHPGHAKPASKAIFMIHGDVRGFEAAFFGLSLYNDPPQESMPVFMARHAIDVWGISYRWAQVPVGYPDQSFMAGWGMDVAVSDARVGLRIARVARWLSGQGHQRLHVVGFSRGVWATMALANAEATEPPGRRDVGGLIPVDGSFKGDPANEAWRQGNCSDYAWYQDLLAAGTYGEDTSFLQLVGQLALDAPNEPSPFVTDLTNAQFAIGVGIWPQDWPGIEWFHNAAGTFDGDIPAGMVYIDPQLFFVELTKVFGFNPVLYRSDAASVTCDELDVPWDDHLSEVRVPLFYVGAAGGFGTVGEYLTQIVGSPDVSEPDRARAASRRGHTGRRPQRHLPVRRGARALLEADPRLDPRPLTNGSARLGLGGEGRAEDAEHDPHGPQADLVPVHQRMGPIEAYAVEVGPVLAAEVLEDGAGIGQEDPGVTPGDTHGVDPHQGFRRPPEHVLAG